MTYLDPLNGVFQDLRCQFFDICVFRNRRADFPPLHAFGKRLYLLQHIRIEDIVIYPMRLGANLWMPVVVHAYVYVCLPTQQMLAGYSQWMPTLTAVKESTKQVEPLCVGWTLMSAAYLFDSLKLFLVDDCFMG